MPASYELRLDRPELVSQVTSFERRRMASLVRRVANQARQDVPVRTGRLGQSIRAEGVENAGEMVVSGSVTANTDYALYVHEGTRPHLIRPKRAKALRFEVGGRVVFAKLVRHPGTKARPFLRNAGERVAAAEM